MRGFKLISLVLLSHLASAQHETITLQDGIQLYVEEEGEGQPIIFIPGWTMTHRFFENQKDFFSQDFYVISYDPRGQGRSGKADLGNNYLTHARDLRELILQKDLNNVVLVGWSNGCLTVNAYLRKFGIDRIEKLVFIDEPPKWVGDTEKEWVYGSFDDYRSSLKRMISEPSNPDDIIDWMLNDSISMETRQWMRAEIKRTSPEVSLSLYVDGLVSDYTTELVLVDRLPTLFMVRNSWYKKATEWLAVYATNASVIAISSHAMFWERPEEFNLKLLHFLNSN